KLPMRVGKTVQAADVTLTLNSISSQGPGQYVSFSFSSESSIEAIRKINFYTPEGKLLDAQLNSRYERSSSGGMTRNSSLIYSLNSNLEEVEVEVTYIEKLEDLTLPIEIQINF